jgi:hypothetical protein
MKKIILVTSFFFTVIPSFAQLHLAKDSVMRELNDIGVFVANNYHPDTTIAKNTCWEGCVFIRFNIEAYQITNIAYTLSTPEFIRKALINAFAAINKSGMTKNQLMQSNIKTYLLPLLISNKQGCGFMTGWENINYKPDGKMAKIYERRQEDLHQSENSIWNILNFTDGKVGTMDCILLSPVRMSGMTY